MQYSVRFFISWITSAVLMYAAFYAWHGLFLNDLNRISFSKALFLLLAALVYLIISYVLYRLFETKTLSKYVSSPMLRGVVSGVMLGFIIFAGVAVLGISFTKNITFEYLVVDCGWQMAEQLIGGIVIAFGRIFIFEPNLETSGQD